MLFVAYFDTMYTISWHAVSFITVYVSAYFNIYNIETLVAFAFKTIIIYGYCSYMIETYRN